MASVELTFTALPVHVRTARLIVTAVARRSGVEESLLDEVRLAVGEACSQVVEAHRQSRPEEPVRLLLRDDDGRFEVVVTGSSAEPPPPSSARGTGNGGMDGTDRAVAPQTGGADGAAGTPPVVPLVPQLLDPAHQDDPAAGLGLAVIAGLADDVEVSPSAGGRLRIRMSWPTAAARQRTG